MIAWLYLNCWPFRPNGLKLQHRGFQRVAKRKTKLIWKCVNMRVFCAFKVWKWILSKRRHSGTTIKHTHWEFDISDKSLIWNVFFLPLGSWRWSQLAAIIWFKTFPAVSNISAYLIHFEHVSLLDAFILPKLLSWSGSPQAEEAIMWTLESYSEWGGEWRGASSTVLLQRAVWEAKRRRYPLLNHLPDAN